MTTPTITYPRAPSQELLKALMPGESLAPLIDLNGREFNGTELDVHFRVEDEIQVYCGLTTILTVQRFKRPAGHLSVRAYRTYERQPSANATGIFRRWGDAERGFGQAMEAYLKGVNVNRRFVEGEGAVQSRWSRVTEPWVPFDREAVLRYRSTEQREEAKQFPEVEAAFESIQAKARHGRWKELKPRARKVDQLAIDPTGRLVLIELKDSSANDDRLYYAPFQLLQYVWEWHNVLEAVRGDLQNLIDARVAVGLTPAGLAPLTGGIRGAIGFGPDERTAEVKSRYETVLEIANCHLPSDVAPIETWEHIDSGPSQIP